MGVGRLFILSAIVLLAVGFFFGGEYITVAAGDAAKSICSAIHTGKNAANFIQKEEIGSQQFPVFSAEINGNDVTVSTSLFGLFKRTARYYSNIQSCVLLPYNEDKTIWDSIKFQRKETIKTSANWPIGDESATNSANSQVNYESLNLLLDAAFHEPIVEGIGIVRRTRAVVIIYDGKIIAERYAAPYDENTRLPGWELSKPLFATLIGKQIADSKLALEQKNLISSWKDSRSEITIKQLLTDTSGLNFNEGADAFTETGKLLFNSKSSLEFASSRQKESGSKWSPSSANAVILNKVYRDLFKSEEEYWASFNAFFDKINLNSLVVDTDAVGDFIPSTFAHATARDWARFGLFTLQRGNWGGEQVLPKSWFDFSLSPENGYGAFWYLNTNQQHYKSLPEDTIFYNGRQEQGLAIIPSKKLVVLRLGGTHPSKAWNQENFLKKVVESIKN